MRFSFELDDIEDIIPWGQPGTYHLTWFERNPFSPDLRVGLGVKVKD